jgi:N12 class adenine-specific DNA methylase/SAM-dependent methyltransferase
VARSRNRKRRSGSSSGSSFLDSFLDEDTTSVSDSPLVFEVPDTVPARIAANVAAVTEALRVSPADQSRSTLARFTGWGGMPELFDSARHAEALATLTDLLGEDGVASARRSINSSFHTSTDLAAAMWTIATDTLGFTAGRVLEPGCGSGRFLAGAPASADMTGIELDPASAAVAAALFPQADIRTSNLTDLYFSEHGDWDLAIANVPFGEVIPHDPIHNAGKMSLHNYFLVKTLRAVRPGGYLLALTSTYTMDAKGSGHRRAMADLAHLEAAIRLPAGTFDEAGTAAAADLLIFRRRQPTDTSDQRSAWIASTPITTERWRRWGGTGTPVEKTINTYFDSHPDHILATPTAAIGQFGPTIDWTPTATTLASAVTTTASQALQHAPQQRPPGGAPEPLPPRTQDTPDGTIASFGGSTDDAPQWFVAALGVWEPLSVPASAHAELQLLVDMRDALAALTRIELATDADDPAPEPHRTRLRQLWTSYQTTYGSVLRGTVTPTDGGPRRRTPKAVALFSTDPGFAGVAGLEAHTPDSVDVVPAAILRQRILHHHTTPPPTTDPAVALARTLATEGGFDLAVCAAALDATEADTRQQLLDAALVYRDPGSPDDLIPSEIYLSGDVRTKLDLARAAAMTDPDFSTNVTALERIQPPDLGIDDIEPRLGASWIDDEIHTEFLRHLLDTDWGTVSRIGPGMWDVNATSYGVLARSTYGTQNTPTGDILHRLLENRSLTMYHTLSDGNRVVDVDETAAVATVADEIREQFALWLWSDPDRTHDLVTTYNRMFNSQVKRDYAPLTAAMTFPGLSDAITLRDHQKLSVARNITQPSAAALHAVGAGKTLVMICTAMELRRTGLANRPCIVVPNHLLHQIAGEFKAAYPSAKVLAVGSDRMTKADRSRFMGQALSEDWDVVILTHTAFGAIPPSPDAIDTYVASELALLRASLVDGEESLSASSRKRLEKALERREAQLERLTDKQHDALWHFGMLGIDHISIDEAHLYKNLSTISSQQALAIGGSQRATDLIIKLSDLREQRGSTPHLLFATGTPISNSLSEAHVLLRYLAPDILASRGVTTMDDFAATFITTTGRMAPRPEGGWAHKEAPSAYSNVPEMVAMLDQVADVRMREDLDLPLPTVTAPDGVDVPERITVPSSSTHDKINDWIAKRAVKVRDRSVEPDVDNLLKITNDGRKAAMDPRLVSPSLVPPPGHSKVDVIADTVADIYQQHRTTVYPDSSGEPSSTPGGLQMVFADLGTPKPDSWNFYDALKDALIDRGLPASAVRFIHEATNDGQKNQLFNQCREGEVSVIIGSTNKLGVGTNVQRRLVALHHADLPWRPADMEQREGRILRQGNLNDSVRIITYLQEGSFDQYIASLLSRKAGFVRTILVGGTTRERTVQEIVDEMVLNYSEVEALASGDLRQLELADLQNQAAKLRRSEKQWRSNRNNLRTTIATTDVRLPQLAASKQTAEQLLADRTDTHGDAFTATIAGTTYTDRTEANAAVLRQLPSSLYVRHTEPVSVDATVGNVPLEFLLYPSSSGPQLRIRAASINFGDWTTTRIRTVMDSPAALIKACEKAVRAMDSLPADIAASIESHKKNRANAEADLARPFRKADELADLDKQITVLREAIEADAKDQDPDSTDTDDEDVLAVPTADTVTAPAPFRNQTSRQA